MYYIKNSELFVLVSPHALGFGIQDHGPQVSITFSSLNGVEKTKNASKTVDKLSRNEARFSQRQKPLYMVWRAPRKQQKFSDRILRWFVWRAVDFTNSYR